MHIKIKKTLTFMFFMFNLLINSYPLDLYISSNGNDGNTGLTINSPLKSLQGAKQKVRFYKSTLLTQDINIFISGGTYELQEPIEFSSDDGGIGNHFVNYIAYSSQIPIVSGGEHLGTNWVSLGNNVWEYQLGSGFDNVRELYINHQRKLRSSHDGHFSITNIINNQITLNGLPSGIINQLTGKEELIIYHDWNITRTIITNINTSDYKLIVSTTDGGLNLSRDVTNVSPKIGNLVKLENFYALLDQPFEWCFNQNQGKIILKTSGENPNNLSIVIPKLTTLVKLTSGAQNITFNGIQFMYTTWQFQGNIFPGIQGDFHSIHNDKNNPAPKYTIPPSILMINASKIKFNLCKFRNMGNSAVGIGVNSNFNSIYKCEFSDIGGTGIYVGLPEGSDYSNSQLVQHPQLDWGQSNIAPIGNEIQNSTIHDCANQYFGSVGIWIQYVKNTRISNNKIYSLPYTGISAGFSFSEANNSNSNNIIENNDIFNVANRLADGSGIYTNGNQGNLTIRNNYIHDIMRNNDAEGASIQGLFFDQGSKNIKLEDNYIKNVLDPVFSGSTNRMFKLNFNQSQSNITTENITFNDFVFDFFNNYILNN